MSTVSTPIQRAINEALCESNNAPDPSYIRARTGTDARTKVGWDVQVKGQGDRSQEALNHKFRSNSRDEFPRFPKKNEDLESTHDMNKKSRLTVTELQSNCYVSRHV